MLSGFRLLGWYVWQGIQYFRTEGWCSSSALPESLEIVTSAARLCRNCHFEPFDALRINSGEKSFLRTWLKMQDLSLPQTVWKLIRSPSRRRQRTVGPQGERLKYLILLSPEPVRAEVTRSMNGFSHSLPIEMTSMGDSSFGPTAKFGLNLRVRLERHDGR